MDLDAAIEELENHENDLRFQRLVTICGSFFEGPRIRGSHHFYQTPWQGSPYVNIQADGGKAKPYQIRQVIKALRRLQEIGA